jgi:hypothetical protein
MRPTDQAVQYVRDDKLTTIRIPRLFAHFFDVHFLTEKGVRRFQEAALNEMTLAIRWAVLLADELFIPAASYYESALCRKVLSAYPSELFGAQIALVASGTSLDEFIEDKLRQYAPNLPQPRHSNSAGIPLAPSTAKRHSGHQVRLAKHAQFWWHEPSFRGVLARSAQ